MLLVTLNPIPMDYSPVADWAGATCVGIAKYWCISSKHQGGQLGFTVNFTDKRRTPMELIIHPTMDVQLVRLKEPLPLWYSIRNTIKPNDSVYLTGYGLRADIDQEWTFPREPRWGTNKALYGPPYIMTNFSHPQDPSATPHEAQCALYDSGGGILSKDENGLFHMEGTIISIGGSWGKASYGQTCTAVALGPIYSWIGNKISNGSDINIDGTVSVSDLFSFLDLWFKSDPKADFDGDTIINNNDLFGFIGAWFENKDP